MKKVEFDNIIRNHIQRIDAIKRVWEKISIQLAHKEILNKYKYFVS
jgi:hypothetical protein